MIKGNGSGGGASSTPDVDYQSAIVKSAVGSCGADNTGVSDTHTAINNCISGLSSTGGTVMFTPGTYNLGTAGMAEPYNKIRLECSGGPQACVFTYSGSGSPLTVGALGTVTSGVQLINLTFDITSASAGATGPHIITTNRLTLNGNYVITNDNGATYANGKTCYWLDGGNDGVISTFGTSVKAENNYCNGSFWRGVVIAPTDTTFVNAYTQIDWIGGLIVSNTSSKFAAAPVNITGATNASPIVLTVASLPSYLVTGQRYSAKVSGVGGNTAANDDWDFTVVDSTHVSLINSFGNGAYTSGGTFQLAAEGLHIESGSEFRGSPDLEGWQYGIVNNANNVGCITSRTEVNGVDLLNTINTGSCFISPSLTTYNDKGVATIILGGGNNSYPLPYITLTNGAKVTGASDGSNPTACFQTYAHQGTLCDFGISSGGYLAHVAEINTGTIGTLAELRYRFPGSLGATQPTCNSAREGEPWYAPGSGGTNGALSICQNQSGTYTWVAAGSGGGSGAFQSQITDAKVSNTTTVVTIPGATYRSGNVVTTLSSSATITAGANSLASGAQIWIEFDPATGQLYYVSNANVTQGNLTLSNITQGSATASGFTSGRIPIATCTGTGGASSVWSACTDVRTPFSVFKPNAGTNISLAPQSDGSVTINSTAINGTVATASTGISGSAGTPIFSLSPQNNQAPVRFEVTITASTPVTGITINNKTSGAKFSIVWTQPASNPASVTIGAAVAETPCAVTLTPSKWTEQFFEVGADGSTVHAVGCSTNDTTGQAPTNISSTCAGSVTYAAGGLLTGNQTVTTTGSCALGVTGMVAQGYYSLVVVQGSGGSHTLTLSTGGTGGCTAWKVSGGGAGTVTPTTTAGAVDLMTWFYDGTNCYANYNKNFN